MVYKYVYLNILLFLLSAFMLCVMKMSLKGEVGVSALNSHGNYMVDHGKSWKNHGIVFLDFCGKPVSYAFKNSHPQVSDPGPQGLLFTFMSRIDFMLS